MIKHYTTSKYLFKYKKLLFFNCPKIEYIIFAKRKSLAVKEPTINHKPYRFRNGAYPSDTFFFCFWDIFKIEGNAENCSDLIKACE